MTDIGVGHRRMAYATGGFGLSVNAVLYLLVPLRAHEFGAGVAMIGVLVGTKALVETVWSVPAGTFIDRIGPRRAMIVGMLGTAVVAGGYVVAPSLAVLFLLQVAAGVFRLLGWVGGQSYVSGLREGKLRSYDTGRFSFTANLGQIVAPLAAGFIAGVWTTAVGFLVVTALGVVFGLLGLLLPAP